MLIFYLSPIKQFYAHVQRAYVYPYFLQKLLKSITITNFLIELSNCYYHCSLSLVSFFPIEALRLCKLHQHPFCYSFFEHLMITNELPCLRSSEACQTTRSSTHSHPFQVSLPNPRTLSHKSSFIPRTCNLWNVLPSSCFPESYNLPSFKSKMNKLDLIFLFS